MRKSKCPHCKRAVKHTHDKPCPKSPSRAASSGLVSDVLSGMGDAMAQAVGIVGDLFSFAGETEPKGDTSPTSPAPDPTPDLGPVEMPSSSYDSVSFDSGASFDSGSCDSGSCGSD